MAIPTTDPRTPFLTIAQAAEELAVTRRRAAGWVCG